MNLKQQGHAHTPATVHVLVVKAGIPYEIEQQVCLACHAVLDEKPVKRTAA